MTIYTYPSFVIQLLVCWDSAFNGNLEVKTSADPLKNIHKSWGQKWKVSFDVKINSFCGRRCSRGGSQAILHLTGTGNSCCSPGDRIPYFGLTSSGIRFATQLGDDGNADWRSPSLPENVWFSIEVEQKRGVYDGICKVMIFCKPKTLTYIKTFI